MSMSLFNYKIKKKTTQVTREMVKKINFELKNRS